MITSLPFLLFNVYPFPSISHNPIVFTGGVTYESFLYSRINPALLPYLENPYLFASHSEGIKGIRSENLEGYINLWGITSGLSLYLTHTKMEGRDTTGLPTGDFFAYYGEAAGSFGKAWKNFNVGIRSKLLFTGIKAHKTIGISTDGGFCYKLKPFSFGFSLNEFGPPIKLKKESIPLPLNLRFGIGYKWKDISFNTELIKSLKEKTSLALSFRHTSKITISAGGIIGEYKRAGANLKIPYKNFDIIYAILYLSELGFTYHLGIGFNIRQEKLVTKWEILVKETAQKFLEEGDLLYNQKEYLSALFMYDKALIWDPHSKQAKEKYEASFQKWQEENIRKHLMSAQEQKKKGDLLEALIEYQYLYKIAPEDTLIKQEIISLLKEVKSPLLFGVDEPTDRKKVDEVFDALRKENFEEFFELLNYLVKKYPNISLLEEIRRVGERKKIAMTTKLLEEALAFKEKKLYKNALMKLENLLKLDPNNKIALSQKNELLLLIKDKESQIIQQAKELYDKGMYNDARLEFVKVLALNPENSIAKEYIQKIEKKIKREDIESLYMKAFMAYAKDDIDTAIRIWEEILNIDPKNERAKDGLERAKRKKELLKLH